MSAKNKENAVIGGGCFWCTEAIFRQLRGVADVVPGYAGGLIDNPDYYNLHETNTGHAEVIRITFDPAVIPYRDLLDIFFHAHNPTTLNQQGVDRGSEYRSIILYNSNAQHAVAKQLRDELNRKEFKGQIVTEIKPLGTFYPAEEYHKNFYEKNAGSAYCQIVIDPKLQALREKYSERLK